MLFKIHLLFRQVGSVNTTSVGVHDFKLKLCGKFTVIFHKHNYQVILALKGVVSKLLWSCVGGEVLHKHLVLSMGLMMQI